MEKISEDDRYFRYKSRATYAPAAGVLMALVFGALGIFKSRGLIEFFTFTLLAVVSSWAATVFFEAVDLELDVINDSATLSRTRLHRFKPVTEHLEFQLSHLSCVWMEVLVQYNYRLNLRFGKEWLPLTIGFPQKPEVKRTVTRLLRWLDARQLLVATGEGPLPTAETTHNRM